MQLIIADTYLRFVKGKIALQKVWLLFFRHFGAFFSFQSL